MEKEQLKEVIKQFIKEMDKFSWEGNVLTTKDKKHITMKLYYYYLKETKNVTN